MPYKTVKQNCTRSDGKKGKYVLKYKPKSKTSKKKDGQGFVKAGCHTSKKKASAQRAAIEGGPREADEIQTEIESLQEKVLRLYVRNILQENLKYPINEGMFDFVSNLADSAIQSVKEAIAKKLVSVLDMDTDGMAAKVVINFFGNLEVKDISNILTGENKCEAAIGELAAALTETLVEGVPEMFGLKPKGTFAKVSQEALSTALTKDVNDKIARGLCDINFAELAKDIPGVGAITKYV